MVDKIDGFGTYVVSLQEYLVIYYILGIGCFLCFDSFEEKINKIYNHHFTELQISGELPNV